MTDRKVIVVGAGGHSKVVISTLRACHWEVVGVYDDDVRQQGTSVLGVPVLGTIDSLQSSVAFSVVIAIGTNVARQQVADRLSGINFISAVHPSAYVDPTAKIGPGSVVFAGAVIQPSVVIGAHCIINTRASIDHDCILDDFVHIAPGVSLAGHVSVGQSSMLGIGSVVLPGKRIGHHTMIGAGSVVINDIPDSVTAVGVPARILTKD